MRPKADFLVGSFPQVYPITHISNVSKKDFFGVRAVARHPLAHGSPLPSLWRVCAIDKTPRMQFAIFTPSEALFLDRPGPHDLNSLADG
jgi:hypothetical protein